MQLAPEKSKLLCEYITQILSDNEKVSGEIRIDSDKINKERMIIFYISVPKRNFEKSFPIGIPTQQIDVVTNQILNDLVENFLGSETMGCTRYYTIRGGYGMNMDGINAKNIITGSNIKINFACRGDKFQDQVNEYNAKLEAYAKEQQESKGRLK